MATQFPAIVLDALDGLVPADAAIALLDFPNHGNVGDNLIWLGQRLWMRHAGLRRIVYVSDADRCDEDTLRRRLGRSGVILMNGGGNFGDLYTGLQAFRERIVRHFPQHRIVQLPQSIHFTDAAAAERAAAVFRRHDDFHLVVRERHSLRLADALGLPARLCPDMALALSPAPARKRPSARVVCLLRGDGERKTPELRSVLESLFPCVDWISESLTVRARAERFVSDRVPNAPAAVRLTVCDWLAAERLARGRRLLETAAFVVTDRLHAHLLCCLLGIPHCVLDNSYGKVRAVYDAWTHAFTCARWCDGLPELMAVLASRGDVAAAA